MENLFPEKRKAFNENECKARRESCVSPLTMNYESIYNPIYNCINRKRNKILFTDYQSIEVPVLGTKTDEIPFLFVSLAYRQPLVYCKLLYECCSDSFEKWISTFIDSFSAKNFSFILTFSSIIRSRFQSSCIPLVFLLSIGNGFQRKLILNIETIEHRIRLEAKPFPNVFPSLLYAVLNSGKKVMYLLERMEKF